jgi:hypothetical protein
VRIGVLGSGEVGRALARGYLRHGHDVRIGTRQAEIEGLPVGPAQEVAAEADVVVLAVRGTSAVELVSSLAAELEGKVLIDATNPLSSSSGTPSCSSGPPIPSASRSSGRRPGPGWSRGTTRSATR